MSHKINKQRNINLGRNRKRKFPDLLNIIQQIHCICDTHYIVYTLLKNRHPTNKFSNFLACCNINHLQQDGLLLLQISKISISSLLPKAVYFFLFLRDFWLAEVLHCSVLAFIFCSLGVFLVFVDFSVLSLVHFSYCWFYSFLLFLSHQRKYYKKERETERDRINLPWILMSQPQVVEINKSCTAINRNYINKRSHHLSNMSILYF